MMSFNDVLSVVKSTKLINLSHQIDENNLHFPSLPNLKKKDVLTLKGGFHAQEFSVIGQYEIHIDTPIHLVASGERLDEIPLEDLLLSFYVIGRSDAVAANPSYELMKQNILAFEKYHGEIPPESFAALHSNWSKRWPSQEALTNLDENGVRWTLGWSREALELPIHECHVEAVGHETFDTDSGQAAANANGKLQQEYYVLGRDIYQVEVLINSDKLPPTGAFISITYPSRKEATGSLARTIAYILEDDATG